MLKEGKLTKELLEKHVLGNIICKRDDVLIRAGIGEDCAVMEFGSHEAVVSIDPITAAVESIGQLAVHVGCNDIAAQGVAPAFLILTLLLPIGTETEELDKIMKQAGAAAAELGVEIVGGHTEITASVRQPVAIMAAIGKRLKNDDPRGKASAGDRIYMTKYAAMEGTGILAADYPGEIAGILTKEEIEEARALLDSISVVKEGVIAGECGIPLMHDATEGGVLGAIIEICEVAGLGADVDIGAVPLLPSTKKIAEHLGVDMLRMISSGCMIMIVPGEREEQLMKKLADAGIAATKIGRLREGNDVTAVEAGVRKTVTPQERDELYEAIRKLTESAEEKN